MSSKPRNPFVFAIVMSVIVSVLLTGAAVGFKSRQDENIRLDQQKNILMALGLLQKGQKSNRADIMSLYASRVSDMVMLPSGELAASGDGLPIHILKAGNDIAGYAVPLSAYGLWSWIYGYVALEGDGETVLGMSVYKHGETPGLGGEVEKAWFLDQYKGKKIVDAEGQFVSVGVAKGKVQEKLPQAVWASNVDGISGATLTSQGVDVYMRDILKSYEPYSRRLRGSQ